MSTPAILVIHNFYRNKGGEDTVVAHEVAALRQAGAEVHELYFQNPHAGNSYSRLVRFFSGIFFNIKAYGQVFRKVRQHGISVVHVHNIFYQASPSVLWAARHAGARVVVTQHNYRLFCLNALFYRQGQQCTACFDARSFYTGVAHGCFRGSRSQSFFLAAALNLHRAVGSWHRAVDQFIIVNPAMRFYLEGMGIAPRRIHLKPNCIDDQPFTPYQQRSGHYLFAGRLEAEKGLPEILDSWQHFSMPLHIAGDGTLRHQVAAYSGDRIRYLGLLNNREMQRELATCRALLFGSRLMEGMPLSIIEAMASGVVCIARRTAVTQMLISDGVTGLLFDTDAGGASFRQAVQTFEQMTLAQRETMALAARRSYEQRFSLQEHIRHIAHVYGIALHLPAAARSGTALQEEVKAIAL